MANRSEVIETTDIEVAEHILSGAYTSLRLGGRGEPGRIRLATTALSPSVRIDHNTFTFELEVTGAPLDGLAFGHLRSGQAIYGSGGTERCYRPGDAFLAAQPDHPYRAKSAGAELHVAFIDPQLLDQLAEPEPGPAGQAIRFSGYAPISAQAARQWKEIYGYVSRTVFASPATAREPLIAGSAARLLAAAALSTFPNNAGTDPTIEDRHDSHAAILRRATVFIDEHAHTDLSLADVATAAHVTIRAIKLAFRRHLNLTPMEYVRRVRLEHAHRDLVRASPATGATVSGIARRWGFPSASRFAALYRQAYGISPGQTLRRD
jgi:AraC-like DNA-binding protein